MVTGERMPTDTVLNTIPRPTIGPSPEVLSMTRHNRRTCYKTHFRHTDAFIGHTYWTHFRCQPRRIRCRHTRRILDVPACSCVHILNYPTFTLEKLADADVRKITTRLKQNRNSYLTLISVVRAALGNESSRGRKFQGQFHL